jgi:hypothetical protein
LSFLDHGTHPSPQLSEQILNHTTTFRRTEEDEGNDSSDSEWIAVNVRSREDHESEEDEGSIVEISRGGRASETTGANCSRLTDVTINSFNAPG